MAPTTIAALAVGGIVVGALTAGVGLVASMVVVGIGAAAGGGAAAITQGGKSEKEKFLTLACDSYHDAERWTDAIETQIRELGDSLYDFPLIRGPSSGLASRNAPPEKKLESVEQWIRWSKWKLNSVLHGIRIFEQDKIITPTGTGAGTGTGDLTHTNKQFQSETAQNYGSRLLRVNVGMAASPYDVFTILMNMPQACLSGIIRSCRVIESMDNQTDIIYMELNPVYLPPTSTSILFYINFFKKKNTNKQNKTITFILMIYIGPRDLVLARYWKHNNDGSYVICLDSIEHREYPVRSGFVRAELHGVYIITPPKADIDSEESQTGESLLTFIGQVTIFLNLIIFYLV